MNLGYKFLLTALINLNELTADCMVDKKLIMKLIQEELKLTAPGPSVDGPPTKAIILAPEPGTQTPNMAAATLNAAPVHRDERRSAGTGHGSFCSSSIT